MLRPVAMVIVAGVLALAGCTSPDSEEKPSAAPMTEITVECGEYADTAERITEAQTAMYTGDDAALADLQAELESLGEGAPENVQAAIAGLSDGFRTAQELLADPTEENKAALVELAPTLAEDSQLVTDYILAECGG